MTPQPPAQPVELLRGDAPPAQSQPGVPIPGIIAAAVLLAAFLALAALHARSILHRRLPPTERAFRRLARARGITPRRRRLVRALAEMHGDAEPVALLISDTAMRCAIDQDRKANAEPPPGTTLEDLARLMPR